MPPRFDTSAFSLAVALALNGRSLRQVAAESGVSQATLSRLLRCVGTPDIETILALCEWMCRSPLDFMRLSFAPSEAESVETAALRARLGRIREQLAVILGDV